MAKRIKSVTQDPRYPALVKRYRYDWKRLAVELVGKKPSWQQRKIIDSAQRVGARTTVSSGHGTGKSDMTSIMIIAFMLCFPNARVVLVANNARQVQIGVWKYLKSNWNTLLQKHGWLQQYFTITETAFFENSAKGIWQTSAKSCRIGNEEALAGEHAKHLFVIVDEASGVSDKAFGVLAGALTEKDNRMLLLSQPTRPSGYFYDTHHRLAEPSGRWRAIRLNSEESPFVTVEFILDKRLEYGGREAPEYLIKVRGEFPSSIAGMLLSRDALDKSARLNLEMPEGWGWAALVDVGNGRDRSILNICKVWGQRMERIVKNVKLLEQPSTVDPVRFADIIHAECSEDLYPNITIAVDSDGVGYDTATCLERYGRRVQRIRWGKKMHSTSDKQRFFNQRAYANVMARDSINQGRMQIDKNVKTAEQGSKIPCAINESGQWVMMPKPVMKEKLNIPSPDRWDTYCFSQLVDYVPHEMEVTENMLESRSSVEQWVLEALDSDAV
ncbi:terminase [Vibrio parahaemolyticus]|uniref:terminase n=1 Tax=Vibrio parahaemolyticus TaxID=670 RepID=UPI00084A5937|nr:terminase [Vibrio parahaemolyticus]EGR3207685.1 terminase [Vibrio parahaemolyticus]EJF4093387.1 terminase [Vibrio parahaemolyticus]EJG0302469.1 terminase [Vibrio parahaemolyticus]EJG0514833.1 terminase [Vibrio parahaemolyticus]ODW08944.1 terminase [Vibrio parahaemolyticus]